MRLFPVSATTMTPVEGITSTPIGKLNLAAAPVPSANAPSLPLPASVVTTPRGVTRRMRWLPVSATTITLLEGITATPLGFLKLAAAPTPSAKAALPLPASVVTTPSEIVTSRILWLNSSATTIKLLEGITATPVGLLKLAAAPMPSAKAPLPLPASVVTTPRGVTMRIRLLVMSATTNTPLEGITATPAGWWKLADAPVPSAKAKLPLPASVVTTPEERSTSRTRFVDVSVTTTTPEGITATPAGL